MRMLMSERTRFDSSFRQKRTTSRPKRAWIKADMQTTLWLSPKRRSFDKIVSNCFSRRNRNGSTNDGRPATSELKHTNCTKDRTVTKPELGTKRLCASCDSK